MRKLFLAIIVVACASSFSFAQSTDDYNKVDAYIGFSHARVDFGGDYEGFNGVEGAVTGNFSRYLGVKGDYAFHFKSFDTAPFNVDAKTHTLVGGLQLKDNSTETKVKPFGHLMAGFQHARVSGFVTDSETGFAGVIGGASTFTSAGGWIFAQFSSITIQPVSAERPNTTSALGLVLYFGKNT